MFFKQYIPSKPAKWGILIRTLACSTNKYIMSFDLHAGS
ncbi:MAG: transposase [Chitinophagales bacterium]|nr:transposase [Chitinophagales bacterium]